MKAERTIETARSKRALAAALSVSRRTIDKYVERRDWPFGAAGPFPVEAIKTWRASTVQKPRPAATENGDGESTERLKRQLLREQIEKARRENQRLADQFIDRDEAQAELRSYIVVIRSGLMGAASSIPRTMEARGLLRGGKRAEAKALVEAVLRDICSQFARSVKRITK